MRRLLKIALTSLENNKEIKRLFDFTFSLIILILTFPVFIITVLAIKLDSSGPVFFVQKRVGKDGKYFRMIKFRSMVVGAESLKKDLLDKNESKDGVLFKIKKDPRITRVGYFIRHLSIDELPQLLNVLKGDMSLVGPRPPLPEEVELYTNEEMKRLIVKPGITGLWQVMGRSNLSFKEQVKLDLTYIRSQNVWLDFFILLKTILVVLNGKGAY